MAVKYSGLLKFTDEIKAEIDLAADRTVEKAVLIDGDGVETPICGGGGSSDFSTANVTVVNSLGRNTGVIVPSISEDYALTGSLTVLAGENSTIKVPLIDNNAVEMYSGETGDKLNGEAIGGKLTVTDGDATKDADNIILIHGDCTITISAS